MYENPKIVLRFFKNQALDDDDDDLDGTFWHPMVSKSDLLYIFNSDLCRSVYITCDGTEAVVSGVTTYHFSPPASVFADPDDDPDNSCFCTSHPDCLHAGVLNVSKCRGADLCIKMGLYQSPAPGRIWRFFQIW